MGRREMKGKRQTGNESDDPSNKTMQRNVYFSLSRRFLKTLSGAWVAGVWRQKGERRDLVSGTVLKMRRGPGRQL